MEWTYLEVSTVTDVAVLRAAQYDGDAYVRQGVAVNRAAPPDVLDWLSRDVDDEVRSCVASNRACPLSAQRRLVRDANDVTRLLLVTRLPNVGLDVLAVLAVDRVPGIRDVVANHPRFPELPDEVQVEVLLMRRAAT